MQQKSGWETVGRKHFILAAALALAVGIVATIESVVTIQTAADSDQLAFFFPAAQRILNGNPFTIYAVRYGTYPNYNPPLSTILMAPLIALAQAIHLPGASACVASGYNSESCRSLVAFVGVWFIPFVALLAVASVYAVQKMNARASRSELFIAFSLIIFSPLIWQNFTTWWHFEQPMMLFFFVAGILQLQSGRPYLAGTLLGLAMLTRTTAAVPLIAVCVIIFFEKQYGILAKLIGVMAVVGLIGIGPFFLFDRQDTMFSLLQWRGSAQIGNSVWAIFIGTPLGSIAKHLDLPTAILIAAALAYFAFRKFSIHLNSLNLWGLIAMAALLVPLLSKTVWPYYYAEPFVFIVIWEFMTMRNMNAGLWRWPILSAGFLSSAMVLSQFMGLPSVTHGGIVLRLMGLINFAVMLAFTYLVWKRTEDAPTAEQSFAPSESIV